METESRIEVTQGWEERAGDSLVDTQSFCLRRRKSSGSVMVAHRECI